MAPKIKSWKDCRSGSTVEKFAEKNGVNVREAAGSHFVMEKDGRTMTGYHSENISTGVAVKIFKFFRDLGIICLSVAVVWFKVVMPLLGE